jgi:ElaB/YqjD/DUF883 family membrane-anchored ribosome-binding protein
MKQTYGDELQPLEAQLQQYLEQITQAMADSSQSLHNLNSKEGKVIDRYRELLAHKESQYLRASQQMRKKHH